MVATTLKVSALVESNTRKTSHHLVLYQVPCLVASAYFILRIAHVVSWRACPARVPPRSLELLLAAMLMCALLRSRRKNRILYPQ